MSQKTIRFARPAAKADDWLKQQSKEQTLTKRISVDLTEEEHRRLKMLCAQNGQKITELVRMWVNQFIEQDA